MSESAELELRQLLSQKLSSEEFYKHVEKRIADLNIPWDERRFFWHYLYNSGCVQEVWHLIIEHLKLKNRVPFDLLISIAARFNIVPDEKALESTTKGLKKLAAMNDLLSTTGFDKWDTRLPEMRRQLQQKLMEDFHRIRTDMLEKFEFLQNERMTEQAGELLKQMRELYPDDGTIIALEEKFQRQWARELISSRAPQENLELEEKKVEPLTDVDAEMVQQFISEIEKLNSSHPHLAYDLAIGFIFFEEYLTAVEVLQMAPESVGRQWLMAELLLASRRFVECLEHLNHLEAMFAKDPESTFAVSYLRAQALKKLGQRDRAIEILRSIVHVRPNYRSCQRLLSEWGAIGE